MRLVVAAICSLLLTIATFAQSDRGSITGTVTDPAKAVIQGATVTATHKATGSEHKTVTTETGNYTISSRDLTENMNFGRRFPIKERMSFEIRAEFFNVFNRVNLPGPTPFNPTAAITKNSAGELTGGFGFVNVNNAGGQRNGQLVARFQF